MPAKGPSFGDSGIKALVLDSHRSNFDSNNQKPIVIRGAPLSMKSSGVRDWTPNAQAQLQHRKLQSALSNTVHAGKCRRGEGEWGGGAEVEVEMVLALYWQFFQAFASKKVFVIILFGKIESLAESDKKFKVFDTRLYWWRALEVAEQK